MSYEYSGNLQANQLARAEDLASEFQAIAAAMENIPSVRSDGLKGFDEAIAAEQGNLGSHLTTLAQVKNEIQKALQNIDDGGDETESVSLGAWSQKVETLDGSESSGVIDLAVSNVWALDMENDFSLSFTGATDEAHAVTLYVTGANQHTLSLPSSVVMPRNRPLPTEASAIDLMSFFTLDGGSTWHVSVTNFGNDRPVARTRLVPGDLVRYVDVDGQGTAGLPGVDGSLLLGTVEGTTGSDLIGGEDVTLIVVEGDNGGTQTVYKVTADSMNQVGGSFEISSYDIQAVAFGADDHAYILARKHGWPEVQEARLIKLNLDTMEQAGVIDFGDDHANDVAAGTDGYVYTCGDDEKVRKIDPSNMSQVGNAYTGHTDRVQALVFGADGYLYSGDWVPSEVHKIDPSDMTQKGVYTGEGVTFGLAFNTDQYLYRATYGAVNKVNPGTMSEADTYDFDGTGPVSPILAGHDGFVYASKSDEVHKINPDGMSFSGSYSTDGPGINDMVYARDGFLYYSELAAGGEGSGAFRRIDPIDMTQSGQVLNTDTASRAVAADENTAKSISQNMAVIYSIDRNTEVHQINTSDLSLIEPIYSGWSGSPDLRAIAYGDDGFLYVSAGQGSTNNYEIHKLDPFNLSFVDSYTELTDSAHGLVFGLDGHLYASVDANTSAVHKINPSNMSKVGEFTGHTGSVRGLAFGADGFLYSGSRDDTVRRIDPETMEQVGDAYTGHGGENVNAVAFGIDGYVYSGDSDGKVHKVNPDGLTQEGVITLTNNVTHIATGTDGYIYVGTWDALHKIDPADMSQVEGDYTALGSAITGLAFAPDGYVYAGADGGSSPAYALHKIDPETMEQVGDTYTEHSDWVVGITGAKSVPRMIKEAS